MRWVMNRPTSPNAGFSSSRVRSSREDETPVTSGSLFDTLNRLSRWNQNRSGSNPSGMAQPSSRDRRLGQSTGGPAPRVGRENQEQNRLAEEYSSYRGVPRPVLDAMISDARRTQEAADQQYQQIQDLAEGMQGTAEAGADDYLDAVGASISNAERREAEIRDLADQQYRDYLERMEEIRGGYHADVDAAVDGYWAPREDAIERARQATARAEDIAAMGVDEFRENIGRYEDYSAMTTSSIAAGISRRTRSSTQMSGGINPDGSAVTPEQSQARQYQSRMEGMQMVQSAITPIASSFNDNRARLDEALAGLTMAESAVSQNTAQVELGIAELGERDRQVRLQAAQAKGEFDLAALGGIQAAMAQRVQTYQRAGEAFGNFADDLRASAPLTATQLQLQGLDAAGRLIAENPQTVVSIFDTMFDLWSASQGNLERHSQTTLDWGRTSPQGNLVLGTVERDNLGGVI